MEAGFEFAFTFVAMGDSNLAISLQQTMNRELSSWRVDDFVGGSGM